MRVSDQQLVLEERRPKRLIHRSLGGYRGEARLMILRGIVWTILWWNGAIHRIPLSLHFKPLTRNGITFGSFCPSQPITRGHRGAGSFKRPFAGRLLSQVTTE